MDRCKMSYVKQRHGLYTGQTPLQSRKASFELQLENWGVVGFLSGGRVYVRPLTKKTVSPFVLG
jgi:hypothetical protein